MANCITCGRALPAFTFGQRREVCDTCRASAVEMPAPNTQPGGVRAVAIGGSAPVTTVLVGMNVAVFVLMVASGVPFARPNGLQLLHWGANFGPLSLGTEWWRILASNYLHAGILHILFNMWCLWDLGHLAERIFDRWTYILIYTVCGIAGSLCSLWWHPVVVGVGASGAIFGLAGALIAALYLGRLPVPKQAVQHTLRSLLTFAGYNLFFGAAIAGVDNSAHIGGLAAGLILGAVLAKSLMAPQDERKNWRLGVFVVAALILLGTFQYLRQSQRDILFLDQSTNERPMIPATLSSRQKL